MADVSLDEVIRQRGINLKPTVKRPTFGRGAGGVGMSFDARQKIGANDVRQRMGGAAVKDAREKLGQKDARFKIRGRGGGGGVQDARQMINSRKQGTLPSVHIHSNIGVADRLSLKRSLGGTQTLAGAGIPLKITKTIQVSILFFQRNCRNSKRKPQLKVCVFGGGIGSSFSMSAPITKVVKNDAYTAPRPPVPVAPTRPTTSMPASRPSAAALQQVSRTLILMTLSPQELFCVCGALKRARLVKVGVAEVVFVRKEDAVSAYRKYNNRCLDGQPMKCNLHIQGNVITSDQPILLRLSDTPGSGSSTKKDGLPPSLSRPAGQRASTQPTPEVDPQTILKALFKSTAQSPSTPEPPNSQATAFRIKI
uniref:Uncharacterized protein n=1 Tax=Periophthalmus magnuspinnatus TaxID=409849 RepID=A0A3B4A4P6_9GOBI